MPVRAPLARARGLWLRPRARFWSYPLRPSAVPGDEHSQKSAYSDLHRKNTRALTVENASLEVFHAALHSVAHNLKSQSPSTFAIQEHYKQHF